MFNISDFELMKFIEDDVPYLDLTTSLQQVGDKKARMKFISREDITLSCTEEAKRVVELLGCKVIKFLRSGSRVKNGEVIFSFEGEYSTIHKAWRSSQLLLEYSSGIATYTSQMKKEIDEVNSNCELLGTRKNFPFAKKFCIKSIMSGGAMPHRLGLSETVLFFPNHRVVYEDKHDFYENLKDIKRRIPEKKLIVESEDFDEAVELIGLGVDVLQMDKVSIEILSDLVKYVSSKSLHVRILAAGGINKSNAKEYAKSGIHGIVTSAMYLNSMANIGSKLTLL
jgi:molybdenum transport protein